MIRKLAWVLMALVLGAAAAYYLRAETGYVLASYGPWVVETSVLGFIATIVVTVLVLYAAARLLLVLFRLPETVRAVLGARRAEQAQASFEGGVQKLIEGQWARAEAELVKRAADHAANGLNYLLAARAAQRAGAPERSDHYLELAASRGEDAAFTAQLVRAQVLLERHDAAGAAGILESLQPRAAENPHIVELLALAYAKLQKWEPLRRLLSGAESVRALPPVLHRQLQGRALEAGLLDASANARMDALKSLWTSASPELRSVPAVRAAYLRGLARLGADREAAAQIPPMLAQGWDPVLVDIYGELTGLDGTAQLATVESWLNQQGEKPEILLAAGRACMRSQLWGKARAYLDVALRLKPGAEVYLALAKLSELTRNPAEASEFYRRGLEFVQRQRSTNHLPN